MTTQSVQRLLNRVWSIASCVMFACLWLSSTAAAGILQGQVTDESTQTPLFSANVNIELQSGKAPPINITTNSDGDFELTDLSAGLYRVTISHIGYSTVVRNQIRVDEDQANTINQALIPKAIDMDVVIVSVSRRPEKYIDAPSAVVFVDADEIRSTVSLSATDHLEKLPAVDGSSTGLISSNVVVRGFNNVLSTTLLSLTDYRIMQLPSLRVNAYQFSTIIDEDIERIELVLGPGSALYGPNASDGVLHMITQSPFSSGGGMLSVAVGERDLASTSIRWAGNASRRMAVRLSGQYYRGFDWQYFDPNEPDSVLLFSQVADSQLYDSEPIDNRRDFNTKKISGDMRSDLLLGRNGILIVSAGLSQVSNIELTDLGAAQARDWRYGYFQIRTNYKDFFAQTYVNFSDAGDSYLRRSGSRLIDRSRLYVGQVQHAYQPWNNVRLTYGLDASLNRPETEGSVHGKNENRDNINSFGVYSQAELRLSEAFQAYAALRFDRDNIITDPAISPRIALIYHAGEEQTLRLSFNRAFSTPSSADFFLDILAETVPLEDTLLQPFFGPTVLNLRGAGSVDGFRFRRGPDSRPQMVSLYGGLLVADGSLVDPNSYLDSDVNSVWRGMRLLLVGQSPALDAILPGSLGTQVQGVYARLNDDGSFSPIPASSVQNITPLDVTTTSTVEMGYKGRMGKHIAVRADIYYTRKSNFVGPLQIESPHVLIDSTSFVNALYDDIFATTGDTVVSRSTAEGIYDEVKDLPIGLVSPEAYQNATDVILTRRNFGQVDLVGLDLAASMHLTSNWNVSGSYSHISKDLFSNVDNVSDVVTNAPRHKFSGAIQYNSSRRAFSGQLHFRWTDGFPVRSGVYAGQVERYLEVNFNGSYRLQMQTELTLTVQNILDNRHIEFVGAPELGRLAILRITRHL